MKAITGDLLAFRAFRAVARIAAEELRPFDPDRVLSSGVEQPASAVRVARPRCRSCSYSEAMALPNPSPVPPADGVVT
jgi:hypothetical protein